MLPFEALILVGVVRSRQMHNHDSEVMILVSEMNITSKGNDNMQGPGNILHLG